MATTTVPQKSAAAKSAKTRQPKITETQCFIDGKWQDAASGETFDTLNPATEEVIAQVAAGDAADVGRAVAAARKQFDGGEWSKLD
ncbi:MAG: aldehyde dehydrogenase family protein, partial [Pirellulaceae bacterium]|nr:aldehyde dehydrogenase family protein [Pirellulaceae bacterium]